MPQFEDQATAKCQELLAIPKDQRNDDWFEEFLQVVPKAFFFATDVEGKPFRGPDGAYYLGATSTRNETGVGACLLDLLDGLLSNGMGYVVNPQLEQPDYVFTFGNLATLKMFGSFAAPESWSGAPLASQTQELAEPTEALVGAPNEGYLPSFIRKPIAEFLRHVGVAEPRVALVHIQDRRSLAFNLTPEALEHPEGYGQVMNLILWHLPMGYTLIEWSANLDSASIPV